MPKRKSDKSLSNTSKPDESLAQLSHKHQVLQKRLNALNDNDPDEDFFDLMMECFDNGVTSVLKELLQKRKLDQTQTYGGSYPALHMAIAYGNEKANAFVQILIDAGAEPNYKPEGMQSALFLSARQQQYLTALVLLDNGAKVNEHCLDAQKNKLTVLHYFANRIHPLIPIIIDKLIAKGADKHALMEGGFLTPRNIVDSALFAVNTQGIIPLHFAAVYSCKDNIAKLLEHNSDPNFKNATGQTPLHALVYFVYMQPELRKKNNFAQSVKLLLASGADLNLKNVAGNSPLDLIKKADANNKNKRPILPCFIKAHSDNLNKLKVVNETLKTHLLDDVIGLIDNYLLPKCDELTPQALLLSNQPKKRPKARRKY